MANRVAILAAVCIVGLLAACGDNGSSAPTVEPPTTPALSQPGDIARVIAAAKAGDRALLGTLLTTTNAPCVVNPRPGILVPPACPQGVAAGTTVPAIVFGGCPDEFIYLDASSTDRVTSFDPAMWGNHLIGVVELRTEPLRYAALFGFEKVAWLGFDSGGKLIGAGGGGDCPADGFRPRMKENAWLEGPDWGD